MPHLCVCLGSQDEGAGHSLEPLEPQGSDKAFIRVTSA